MVSICSPARRTQLSGDSHVLRAELRAIRTLTKNRTINCSLKRTRFRTTRLHLSTGADGTRARRKPRLLDRMAVIKAAAEVFLRLSLYRTRCFGCDRFLILHALKRLSPKERAADHDLKARIFCLAGFP